ncbi:MAG: BON domain-containing protein [Chitinispirillaceae bacterium]
MIYSTEETKKRIIDQLFWDNRVDASGINVEIVDGTVRLFGKVDSRLARQAAETDAHAVPGVTRVDNLLSVVSSHKTGPLPEEEIRNALRSIFEWNPDLSDQDIVIEVDVNVVRLEGAVDAYWKKKKAENLAGDVLGVAVVDNLLTVVPTHDLLDEIIAENVVDALDRNVDIDIDTLDVEVEKGAVTLSGTVPGWSAYRAAQSIAQFTPGVTDVQNDLAIVPEF